MASDKDRSKVPDQRNAKVATNEKDMGAALRSVYEKTVEESVPAEMLELLGKLG